MSFYRHRNSHRHDFNKKDAKFIINGLFTIGSAFVFKVAISLPLKEPLYVPCNTHKSYLPDSYNTFLYSLSGIPYNSGIHKTLRFFC